MIKAQEEEEFRVQFDPKINAREPPQASEELLIDTKTRKLQKMNSSSKEIDDGWQLMDPRFEQLSAVEKTKA